MADAAGNMMLGKLASHMRMLNLALISESCQRTSQEEAGGGSGVWISAIHSVVVVVVGILANSGLLTLAWSSPDYFRHLGRCKIFVFLFAPQIKMKVKNA